MAATVPHPQRRRPDRRVGRQFTGNIGERYRSAAVLDRDNIIKVSVSIFGDAGGSPFPAARPTKPELRELAETAGTATFPDARIAKARVSVRRSTASMPRRRRLRSLRRDQKKWSVGSGPTPSCRCS